MEVKMESDSNNHYIVPFDGQSSLLPVETPGRTLQIPASNKRGLAKLANWLVEHPATRLGMATVAFAAGAYLSRRAPGKRRLIPSRSQRREPEVEEWLVTAVGLSIESDCKQVSVWSIGRYQSLLNVLPRGAAARKYQHQ
jgi:hypothetical protein